MKYLILIVFLFITTQATAADMSKFCDSISTLAKHVMINRQNGIDMSKAMKIAANAGELRKLNEQIIIDAYSKPRFQTDDMQKRIVEDFTNDTYLQCITAF